MQPVQDSLMFESKFKKYAFNTRTLIVSSVVFSLFLLVFSACSETTDPVPKPEDLAFEYSPSSGLVTLFHGDEGEFSVAVSPSVPLTNTWKLNHETVGSGLSLQYSGTQIGIDTLRVDSAYSSVSWNRTWYISVTENQTTIPPAVTSIVISHGPEAADVEVSWHMISVSSYPIVEYQVGMSYEGPITTDNWSETILLGSYPHLHNQVGYSFTYTHEEDGMISGATAWFAVRGVDEAGQMSSIPGQFPHLISSPWYIEGTVYSDDGEILPNVIIDYGCPSCRVNADSEGRFSIGPVPNVNVFDLVTMADDSPGNGEPFDSYYNFTTHSIEYDPDGNYDIMLLSRYGLDDSCENYDFEFMLYFKDMTGTLFPTDLRPNYRLFKWENYPVAVYVPPFISGDGVDFEIPCKQIIEYWNSAMGDEYLVLVDTPEEAGIEFYFGDEGTAYAGRAYVAEPHDQNYLLGDVIPEKVKIYIWDQLVEPINIMETSMHEMGHALGLFAHTACTGGNFVMDASPAGILTPDPYHAVHPDEIRVVRAIRNLPQGTDISAFDFP